MNGFMIISVVFALVAISSAIPDQSLSITKTDVAQGLGEFKSMVLLAGKAPGTCYACSAPCAVAGKGCCSDSIYKQCRQIDGEFCRCTQF